MTAGRAFSGFRTNGSSSGAVMPFDHAATFQLKGIPGNIIQDVINISSDGVFVATAIGYGFEEDRALSIDLISPRLAVFQPGTVRLGEIPAAALIEGFRLNPRSERLLLDDTSGGIRERKFSQLAIHQDHSKNILQHVKPSEEISFLFSIVDSATGRELQDEPINNLASLGRSDGERPFRLLAQPLTFQPRSTIRLQIVERTESVTGTLFIVLYGYKILGPAGGSEPFTSPSGGFDIDQTRVIPFDYVSKFQLAGTPGNLLDDEVPINVEGGFITTSIGYGLAVQTLDVDINQDLLPAPIPAAPNATDLASITLDRFPVSALQDGIRVRPGFVRLAFDNTGHLNTQFPIDALNRCFERLNQPNDVSFRYSIFDTGTGRELQNQPLNNIAGLGIANGDRPFKQLARPMQFLPRSTIRVTVEERFGRGTLFIVFQGYKLLGVPVFNSTRSVRPR
ncbi:MAG TPA: hypothetical protein VJM50_23550 [Pyrinomonadaceae bacterium]|nr:hypothetical protein [Pyrinomonadaceae bacterium]